MGLVFETNIFYKKLKKNLLIFFVNHMANYNCTVLSTAQTRDS